MYVNTSIYIYVLDVLDFATLRISVAMSFVMLRMVVALDWGMLSMVGDMDGPWSCFFGRCSIC